MSRLYVLAAVGLPLLFAGLGLILVSAIAFTLGGGKALPALLPYIVVGLVAAALSGPLLVASLRLPLPQAR
jgi:hypothetical protein